VSGGIQTPVLCKNPDCRSALSPHVRNCQVCETDAGFPNVRASESSEELNALEYRYKAARREARTRRCIGVIDSFERAVNKSKAIICKSVGIVATLMGTDNERYVSFYKSVNSGGRLPEENEWDRTRESGDALIFPHYHREIIFAALSLTNYGVKAYGPVCMVLNTKMIEKRASLFSTNTYNFVKTHNISAGSTVPAGYRSNWPMRAKLAVAKLAASITFADTEASFPARLLGAATGRDSDFIEVHIYGHIHRKAVERIVADTTKMRPADKVLVEALKRKLKEIGAVFEEAT
jgi:hypothetical protein